MRLSYKVSIFTDAGFFLDYPCIGLFSVEVLFPDGKSVGEGCGFNTTHVQIYKATSLTWHVMGY